MERAAAPGLQTQVLPQVNPVPTQIGGIGSILPMQTITLPGGQTVQIPEINMEEVNANLLAAGITPQVPQPVSVPDLQRLTIEDPRSDFMSIERLPQDILSDTPSFLADAYKPNYGTAQTVGFLDPEGMADAVYNRKLASLGAPDPRFSEDVAFLPTPVVAPGSADLALPSVLSDTPSFLADAYRPNYGEAQTAGFTNPEGMADAVSNRKLASLSVPGTTSPSPGTGGTRGPSDEQVGDGMPKPSVDVGGPVVRPGGQPPLLVGGPAPIRGPQPVLVGGPVELPGEPIPVRPDLIPPVDDDFISGPRPLPGFDAEPILVGGPPSLPGGGTTVLPEQQPVSGFPVPPVQTIQPGLGGITSNPMGITPIAPPMGGMSLPSLPQAPIVPDLGLQGPGGGRFSVDQLLGLI